MRTSLRNKTRDKRNHIFDPLIRKKAKHLSNFQKKHSIKVSDAYQNLTNSTNDGTGSNFDNFIKSGLEQTKNFNSGYGDIGNIVKTKKARIMSANPIMNKNRLCKKVGSNLHTSFNLDSTTQGVTKSKQSRPASSTKYNVTTRVHKPILSNLSMHEYLTKIIKMAHKKEHKGNKSDIRKLTELRDRYCDHKPTQPDQLEEIKGVVRRLLSQICDKS